MLSVLCFAALCVRVEGGLQADERLSQVISAKEEIISLSDFAAMLGKKTGVPLYVRRRVGDRKITISFKDRPAREAMDQVARCMLMSWEKTGGGYELDLTSASAGEEARAESQERELSRAGLRDATREIRRLANMTGEQRRAEVERLEKDYDAARKAGEPANSPRLQLLGSEISAMRTAGFIEVVGAAISAAKLDEEGVPVGTLWISSADQADGVGVLEPSLIPRGRNSPPYTDAIGIVTYNEESRELQTRLLAVSVDGGANMTSVGTWSVPTSNSQRPHPIERAMSMWAKPVTDSMGARKLTQPVENALNAGYRSNKCGRANHLLDLAERAGVPVVADAFRRSFSDSSRLGGSTVHEWLESYGKVAGSRWQEKPDYVREEGGWLHFREYRWWQKVRSEIPESTLLPLEAKARGGQSPLSLDDYTALASSLTPAQAEQLKRPDSILLRFPVGSLGSVTRSLNLYALFGANDRARALTVDGVELGAGGPPAQAIAHDVILRMSVDSGSLSAIRSALRLKSVPGDYRFFATDEATRATSPSGVGGGREINVVFALGVTPSRSVFTQTFSCSKAGL